MSATVFAIAAHPDDIEFTMAVTLSLLQKSGCELHYMNIANGSCGSADLDAQTIAKIRLAEAKNSASRLGATFHHPLVPDFQIFYEKQLLEKIGSIMREIKPDILLIHSPQDYLEDHMNACRLALTAAFCRGMRNFPVYPPCPPVSDDVVVYHAQPHGNRDQLNQAVVPDFFINIDSVIDGKTAMLAEHGSQKEWLDRSQGMDAYLDTMKELSREMGQLSGKCKFAEGWRRHSHLGYCDADADPLGDLLKKFVHRT